MSKKFVKKFIKKFVKKIPKKIPKKNSSKKNSSKKNSSKNQSQFLEAPLVGKQTAGLKSDFISTITKHEKLTFHMGKYLARIEKDCSV